MQNYRIEKGKIFSEGGLPWAPRWFCDGRVAFEVDNNGLGDINYFGEKTSGSYIAFHKRFWGGLRLYLVNESGRKKLRPDRCEILPFGFSSTGGVCDFRVFTADDCIYFTVTPKTAGRLDLEFYEDYLFYPETHPHHDIRYGGNPREWKPFTLQNNRLCGGYTEEGVPTNLCFSSNGSLSFRSTERNTKHILSVGEVQPGVETVIALGFSCGEAIADYTSCAAAWQSQTERYARVAERAPVLHSSHPLLDEFFQFAPMYHESLKTTDVKGAIRAQSTHYWVWGWDSMTSSNACFYWGDTEFMAQMLDCMEQYSDGDLGIAHAFDRAMRCIDGAAPPAQGMYLTLLENYRLAGGDYRKHYAFAKLLFGKILATEVRDTGLCRGTSLYPDYRALIHETGNDISAFNNTVSYCAVRCMQRIAQAAGDEETAGVAKAFGDRMQKGFEEIMYNPEIGFIDSSVEADTYAKRGVPTNNAVKWESNDCGDLVSERAAQYLAFYKQHLVSPAGLRPMPEWSDCYDADSNQLHCWWMVMSEFYIRLINRFDEPEMLRQYVGWIEYWTGRLMCPEGIPCYDADPNVPFDNWNCMCGIWHGYSMRGFYNAVVHGFVGVDIDHEGLHIYPYSGEELTLSNLHFGQYNFDIQMRGSGASVASVVLNGEPLGAVTVIPFEKLGAHNTVEVVRK